MFRYALLSLSTLVMIGADSALGDELILEAGDKIRGAVEKQDDKYIITTEEGDIRTYAEDDVKRWIRHSVVSPEKALQMLHELQDMVTPYLTSPEPEMFQWLAKIRRQNAQFEFRVESGRVSATRHITKGRAQLDSERRDTAERELKFDTVFANEWKRYTDPFDILANDARFKALVTRQVGATSLGDFGLNAPEEYQDAKMAVNRALKALDDVFNQAKSSNRKIRNRVGQEITLDDEIMKAKNAMAKAEDEVDRATSDKKRKSAQKKRDKAEARMNSKIRDKTTKLARLEAAARESMAEFAKAEAVAMNEVQIALELVGERLEEPGIAE